MIAAVRFLVATLAIVVSAWIVSTLPTIDGPSQANFIELLLLPIAAALAIAPRTVRFTFVAGAIYAFLAGLRLMLAPGGNVTAGEQLSTAALVALLVPILAVVWRWTAGRALQKFSKGPTIR